jgi:hypothetical protein
MDKHEAKKYLEDAVKKHGLTSLNEDNEELLCLVRYIYNIGYNDGVNDYRYSESRLDA